MCSSILFLLTPNKCNCKFYIFFRNPLNSNPFSFKIDDNNCRTRLSRQRRRLAESVDGGGRAQLVAPLPGRAVEGQAVLTRARNGRLARRPVLLRRQDASVLFVQLESRLA